MARTEITQATGFYQDLYSYVADRTEGRISPFFSAIEITSLCNFRCRHCQASSAVPAKGLPTRRVLSVLDELADLGTFGLIITGGEPLIRQDIFEILNHAKRREFAIQLCTNASLVTEKIADRLAGLYLQDVVISIYGMDEATHRSVTGVAGACSRVLNNIRLLVDRGVRVTMRMPLMRLNIGQVGQAERYAQRIGVPFVALPGLHARFDGCQDPLRQQPSLPQMKKFFLGHPVLLEPSFSVNDPGTRACAAPNEKVAVTSRGEVCPCMFLRRGGVALKRRRIASILRHEPIFKRIPALRWRNLPRCLKCKALPYCRPCPGLFQLETGSLTRSAVNAICRLAWFKKRLHQGRQRP